MSNVPFLVVDTGNSMMDDRSTHGRLRSDALAKDDWVLKGFEQFSTDVVNVSSHDLHFFSGVLGKSDFARRAKTERRVGRRPSSRSCTRNTLVSPLTRMGGAATDAVMAPAVSTRRARLVNVFGSA